jgi:hypothetical protein
MLRVPADADEFDQLRVDRTTVVATDRRLLMAPLGRSYSRL